MSVLDDVSPPAAWDRTPFGRLVTRSKASGRPDLQPLSVYLDDGVVPRSSRDDNHNRLGEDASKYLIVRPGDVVFNKLRTWQGGLGVSRHEGIVSPAYFVCRPQPSMDPRFLHYLLRSRPYLAELTRVSKFMPPSQFDISWDDLRTVPVAYPPRCQQSAIADYLDTETARIDALIVKKQLLLDSLDERIDAMVSAAVGDSALTGRPGLAADIRRLLVKVRRPAAGGQIVTAFRDGQVTARALRRAEGYTEAWTENATYQHVNRGDVVVHGLDGFAGAVGTSEADGVCSPAYHVMEPLDGGDSDFYGRLLHVLATTGYLGLFAVSTRERAVDFRNWDLFGRIPIPVVSTEHQREIGHLIRVLRPLQSKVDQSKVLALEHRQALIMAVVTGELEIPGVAVS